MRTKEFLIKFQNDLEKMKVQTNAALNGFAGLFSKTMAEGELSVKSKELVAIGIAVAKQCEPCIKLHVKKCLDAGATREEILEATGVAVMMGGGPAYTHIPMVIESLDELESQLI
jgi:AhpD family alkylhydroperoxidase